jgi:CRP-like cAMP-binding protein
MPFSGKDKAPLQYMKDALFATLQAISPLSPAALADVDSILAAAHFPKGSYLVREGAGSDRMFFLVKGAARAWYLHGEKEYTDWFVFEHMFFCSVLAFFGGQSSAQHIEALEPCDVLILTRSGLDRLCERHPDMQRLHSVILTQSLLILQQNVIDQRFKTAPERYVQLVKTYPQVLQRVPLKHVASFLGVTQETLSRIRASAII